MARKVSLVGWSLGGLYARQLAKMMPDRVRSVITLGSPVRRQPEGDQCLAGLRDGQRPAAPTRRMPFGGSLSETPPVPTTAIFSRSDGICAWQGCVEKASAGREHRGRQQPLRHRPSSRGGLCRRRSPRAARRPVDAVRPLRLARASSIRIHRGSSGAPPAAALSQRLKRALRWRMAHPLAASSNSSSANPRAPAPLSSRVFGDAIVPRGGSVWLGTLLAFFRDDRHRQRRGAHGDVACRGDGWLERRGRPQQLLPAGEEGTADLRYRDQTIYDPPVVRLDRTASSCLLIGNGEDRDASREALKNAGFGSPLPGVWVAPSGVPVPEEAAAAIRLEVSAEDDSGRRLLSASWPLHRTADAYLKFMRTFEPLRDWIGRANGCRTAMPSSRGSC